MVVIQRRVKHRRPSVTASRGRSLYQFFIDLASRGAGAESSRAEECGRYGDRAASTLSPANGTDVPLDDKNYS